MIKKSLFPLCAAALLLSSCATIQTPVGQAWLFTDVTTNSGVTSNALGNKVGTSSASNVLGLIAVGNASAQKAAKDAGITKISHVDVQQTNVLGIFSTYKTVVYGD